MKSLAVCIVANILLSIGILHGFEEDFWINTTESDEVDMLFVTNIAAAPCGKLFAGSARGFWQSDDRGEIWTQIPISDNGIITGAQVLRDGTIVAGGRDSLHFSSDHGETWTTYTHVEHNIARIDYYRFVEKLDGTLYAAMNRGYKGQFWPVGIWESWDRGRTWSLVCAETETSSESMCIALHPNGDVFWGSWRWKGLFVLRAETGECHSIYAPGGFGEWEWNPYSMAINSRGQIMVGTDRNESAIFTSADTGNTWTRHNHRAKYGPTGDIGTITVDRFDNFFVTALDTVWYSTDFAESWVKLDGCFPSFEFIQATCLDSSDYLYVGTNEGNIYRSREPIYTATGIRDNQPVNSKFDFSLSPNPTTGDLVIDFTLETQGLVTAELFDMRGALVKHVFQREYAAGSHRTTIKMDFVKAGVYVLRLTVGIHTVSKVTVIF